MSTSGGGGGYEMPAEQRKLYELAYNPMYQMVGAAYTGQPLVQPVQPQAYQMANFADYWQLQNMLPKIAGQYDVYDYQVPSTQQMMPTEQTMASISPEVQAGVWYPYEQAAQGMLEQLGAQGQGGNTKTGYSGTAGAALGKFAAQAASQVGKDLWSMVQPAQQMGWQAELGRAQQMAGLQQQRELERYQRGMVQPTLGDYEMQYREFLRGQDLLESGRQEAITSLYAPWQMIPSYVGGLASMRPDYIQQGPGAASYLSGGIMGGLGGAATGASIGSVLPGVGTAVGAGLGGGLGLLGGSLAGK